MIERLKDWSRVDPNVFPLARHFRAVRRRAVASASVAAVQCAQDLYPFALFGQTVSSLRERTALRIEHVMLHSLNATEAASLPKFLTTRALLNPLLHLKWAHAYRSFCDAVGYRSVSFRPFSDSIDLRRAWRSWRGLLDKDALVGLTINGVPVGDLVYDSYLRFRPAPTVDLKDHYLLLLLWQAHRDVRRAQGYFARTRPGFYLSPYTTYIQHGIAVRVALLQGTRVFSFGNYQSFMKELSVDDWMHTPNPDSYAQEFARLPRQDEKLAAAESALSERIAGGIDAATSYMKKSAYAESGEQAPEVRGAVVVFLHDFYDSPHVYRDMVFPDFWEWICFTIETLRASGTPFFIKPHPNQIGLSDAALADLRRAYPGVPMVSPGVTNKQLVEAGMACAVTVYGTVAHEMAFMGVPTIACAHHPHVSFGFCRTARSRDEYAELLRNATGLNMDKALMRRESLAFYYMHNLNIDADERVLLNACAQLRVARAGAVSAAELAARLEMTAQLPAYRKNMETLLACLAVEVREPEGFPHAGAPTELKETDHA